MAVSTERAIELAQKAFGDKFDRCLQGDITPSGDATFSAYKETRNLEVNLNKVTEQILYEKLCKLKTEFDNL